MKIITDAKVFFDASHHCVVIELHGFTPDDKIKSSGLSALELLKSHHCKVVVANQVHSSEPDFERKDWVIDSWLAKATESGMEKFAIVVPDTYFKTVNPKTFKNGKLQISYFHKVEDALKWSKMA